MRTSFLLFALTLTVTIQSCTSNPTAKPEPVESPKMVHKVVDDQPTEKTQSVPEPVKAKTDSKEIQDIKALINFKGNIEESLQWSDSLGKHIVITSEKQTYYTNSDYGENDLQNVEVSCLHYIQKNENTSYEQYWKIVDFVKGCQVDAIANFKKNVLQRTDLNNNGVPEIWTMYYIACKGGVDPSDLKLIMYEGNVKYKMTGITKVDAGGSNLIGGDITSQGKFKEQPLFLDYAKELWKKNCKETFGE